MSNELPYVRFPAMPIFHPVIVVDTYASGFVSVLSGPVGVSLDRCQTRRPALILASASKRRDNPRVKIRLMLKFMMQIGFYHAKKSLLSPPLTIIKYIHTLYEAPRGITDG